MEYDNFYITVKSDDDKKIHKDNKPSNFTITLKTPILLKDKWEIGLATLVIPHTWEHKIIAEKVPNFRSAIPSKPLKAKFESIFIKSNLIEAQLQGTEYNTIIRTIIPHGGHGNLQTFDFNPIYYFPLRVSIIHNINISIYRYKDKQGSIEEEVPFKGGTIVSVLHFRKKLF